MSALSCRGDALVGVRLRAGRPRIALGNRIGCVRLVAGRREDHRRIGRLVGEVGEPVQGSEGVLGRDTEVAGVVEEEATVEGIGIATTNGMRIGRGVDL